MLGNTDNKRTEMRGIFGIDSELIGWISFISGFGGVAYHLWRGEVISLKRFIGATMLSSLAGVLAFMWLWQPELITPTKMIVISVLAGIGATTILDLIVAFLNKQGPKWIQDILSSGWK